MERSVDVPKGPLLRDKRGKFISKKNKQRMDNVLLSISERALKNAKYSSCPGRRIVEFDTLAKELWCSRCNLPLSLRNIVSETHHGLASTLDIICQNCTTKYKVDTCKSYQSESGRTRFPVNGKAVIGMHKHL